MKFTEIPYIHLEYKEVSEKLSSLIDKFKNSTNVNEAVENYNKVYEYSNYIKTMFALSYIRNSLDITDEYYEKELTHGYEMQPKFESMFQEMIKATLKSPFRKELEEKWGKLLFINQELIFKTVSPEVIEELQEENKLVSEYRKLTASAKIEFDGKSLNISQMNAYLENKDRDIRKNALTAMANWYIENKEEFDRIFNELVNLRVTIAKKLGCENFVELAYYRRKRNCYDSKMVAEFRK
ncbi:MAG: M3 family oligoendopeptidase, partial [Defluviitaleaceae bacterium]|nr:M3 family oligoendopeptidase [Defluviitaleaceae bacterium]